MTYRDVTLAPDEIEWDYTTVWEATRSERELEDFVAQNGLDNAIEKLTAAHRIVANKMIAQKAHENMSGRNWQQAYAARRFKKARAILNRRREELCGQEDTQRFLLNLRKRYPRIEE